MIRRLYFIIALVLLAAPCYAQHGSYDLLDDSIGGWVELYKPAAAPKPYTSKGGITYSANKMGDIDNIVQWVQASFIPVGGRGYFKKSFSPQKDVYLPESHGAYFSENTWVFDSRTGKRFEEGGSQYLDECWIITNSLPFRRDIPALCNASQHIFLMLPETYAKQLIPADEQYDRYNLHKDPRFSKYPIYYNNTYAAIILSTDNKLPVIELTRQQVLDLYEKALPQEYEKEKERLKNLWATSAKSLEEELRRLDAEVLPRWKSGIQKIRDKYKGQLNEVAVLNGPNPPDVITFYNGDDIFAASSKPEYLSSFHFYQLQNGLVEKGRQDKPLWVTIKWYQPLATERPRYTERNRAFREHLDIGYIYNYFFNTAAIKGKPYQPLQEELLKATIANYKKRNYLVAPVSQYPKGVFYAEDFSQQKEGIRPGGWFYSFNGNPSIVTTVAGQPGKWLDLGKGNPVSPTAIKHQFPEDFILEYDIACNEYSYRYGAAVELVLGNIVEDAVTGIASFEEKNTRLNLLVTGGNEENLAIYYGSARVRMEFPTGFAGNKQAFTEMNVTDFTNLKRKAHITLRKKGNELVVLLNDKPIPYRNQANQDISQQFRLPAGTKFNGFTFVNNSSQPNQKAFISNIKISPN